MMPCVPSARQQRWLPPMVRFISIGRGIDQGRPSGEAVDSIRKARDMAPQEFDAQLALADAFYLSASMRTHDGIPARRLTATGQRFGVQTPVPVSGSGTSELARPRWQSAL